MRTSAKLLLVLLLAAGNVFGNTPPKLRFHANGEFKIVQFTDTHISIAGQTYLTSYDIIRNVIALEKPDLVILTGDIITEENPAEGYQRLSKIFSDAAIPWAVVFGNHESEKSFTRRQLAGLVEKLPGCLNKDVGGISGNSNFILEISGTEKKAKALLYCLDSNDYSKLKPRVDGYGWFDSSQIEWYRKKSRKYTALNNGSPLPALAFFHIPLMEYTQAIHQKDAVIFGVRNEDECAADVNSGMFTAMLESGDVMGTFVGHDHINDYITVFHTIALAYGRVSKIMKSPEDPLAGGRVIVLKEGKREFNTWIRESNGQKVLSCSYPASFLKQP
jgi:predicted phosphodiesterase